MVDHHFKFALKQMEMEMAGKTNTRMLSADILREYFPDRKDYENLYVGNPYKTHSFGHVLLVFEIGHDDKNKIVVWPDWQRAAILVGQKRFDWDVVCLQRPGDGDSSRKVHLRSPSKKSFLLFEQRLEH